MEKFRLSTDSTCDLYQSFVKENNIAFVPLTFMIEDKNGNFTDYVDEFISYGEYVDFYNKLRSGGYSRTAMLNYQAHYMHFEKMIAEGAKEVVHFTISSGLSPTVDVANRAYADLKKIYPDFTLYAVDPLTATVGQGALVRVALECRNKGMGAKETYDYVMSLRQHLQHCVIPNDLYSLKKGGRVSSASAAVGTVLNIKPMLAFTRAGKLEVVEKCRGMKKAFAAALSKMQENPFMSGFERAYIVHTDNETGANELASLIRDKFHIEPQISIMGPVIGSHVGPGSVSVVWFGEKERN